jgi:hypothetical protein
MSKSKCEQAARAIAKRNWPWIKSEAEFSDFYDDFRLGAEALLRYARKKGFDVFDSGFVVKLEDLEEYVNGAKQGGKG